MSEPIEDGAAFARKLRAELNLEVHRRQSDRPETIRLRQWHNERHGWFVVRDDDYFALYEDPDPDCQRPVTINEGAYMVDIFRALAELGFEAKFVGKKKALAALEEKTPA